MSRFVITDPSNQTQIFEISGSTVSIGRADSNDLMLPHPSVSRNHARVTALPGETVLIIDLGSMNGTFVNGQPIQEQRLADQDRINIGAFELKFDAATRPPFYVEAGRDAGRDITGLIGRDALSAGLHQEIEARRPARNLSSGSAGNAGEGKQTAEASVGGRQDPFLNPDSSRGDAAGYGVGVPDGECGTRFRHALRRTERVPSSHRAL